MPEAHLIKMDAFLQLAEVLERETVRQRELLSLLTHERAAIVHLEQEELNKFQLQKQALVERSKDLERERHAIICALVPDPKEQASLKLSKIIERCSNAATKARLLQVQEELKSLASTTQELNLRNAELIKHALGALGATMAIAFSAGSSEPAPTYGPSGALTDPLNSRRRSRTAA